MTERYRAEDVRVDRAQAHYDQIRDELAGRLLLPASVVAHLGDTGRHWMRDRWDSDTCGKRSAYVPRHAAAER
jgi:hypothetical protein